MAPRARGSSRRTDVLLCLAIAIVTCLPSLFLLSRKWAREQRAGAPTAGGGAVGAANASMASAAPVAAGGDLRAQVAKLSQEAVALAAQDEAKLSALEAQFASLSKDAKAHQQQVVSKLSEEAVAQAGRDAAKLSALESEFASLSKDAKAHQKKVDALWVQTEAARGAEIGAVRQSPAPPGPAEPVAGTPALGRQAAGTPAQGARGAPAAQEGDGGGASESGGDIVIGMAQGTNDMNLAVFIRSLRQHSSKCEIVLFMDRISDRARTLMDRYSVRALPFKVLCVGQGAGGRERG